jgi:pentatricopeptide repeat protein
VDTYVSAFLGSAKLKDLESLEVIHNQLKLDYNVDVNTRLWNALIAGYTACGQPRRALRFWDDISASKEGPTYNSIHIVFRACEKAPFGDLKARELWGKLRRMKVECDQAMWGSYVGALAGNGDMSYVFAEVEKGEREGEVEVDEFVLGSLFNGTPGQSKQREAAAWGRERWPHVWKALEDVGEDVDENGMRLFRIDRSVEP